MQPAPTARKDSTVASSAAVSFFGACRGKEEASSGASSRPAMDQGVSLYERSPGDNGEPSDRVERAPSIGAAAGAGDQQEAGGAPCEPQGLTATGVPVFVMLPLDTVNAEGVFRYASSRWFLQSLQTLAATGIRGVAIDVWWGAVERKPRRYDWSGYRQLFNLVKALGLKIQVVMSFHACGSNVGDNAQIPLPKWVLQAGERDPDIFFTDRPRELLLGQRNKECITIFADEEPGLLKGRSPIQCYTDFMRAFREEFFEELGEWIEEVVVGCGPCGELRYPSYVETNGWRFPGIGEFQCYDRRALASLARAACAVGHPEWGNSGPHDAGNYNSAPEETGFFCSWGGSWDSPYGRFFLSWYSGALLEHGDRMLRAATSIFNVAHTPVTPVGSSTTRWPISKPPSLWDLPAPGRPASYLPPRLQSASAPLLHHQSSSSIEEALPPQLQQKLQQAVLQTQQAAQHAQQEGAGAVGADFYMPNVFDAPLVGGCTQLQLQNQEQAQATQQRPQGLAGGSSSQQAQQQQQQQHPGPAQVQQPARFGDGPAPSPRDAPSPAAPVGWGTAPWSTAAAPPPTPPSADLTSNPGWGPQQQQPQQENGPSQASGHTGGTVSPPQSGGLGPQPSAIVGVVAASGQGGAGQPSPMSVGMLSQPPSMASLRSSISESAEDLTGPLTGEPQPSGAPVGITVKVAGVHWWFRTRSHAAELTAGYYNTETHPGGYAAIAALCAQYGASLTLTCVEMCDSQHPPEALCGPEGLLRAVREVAAAVGVQVAGENALPCFMPGCIDEVALQRVIYNTQPWGTPLQQGWSPDDRDALGPGAPPADMISATESFVPWGSALAAPRRGSGTGGGPGSVGAGSAGGASSGAGSGGSDPPSPTTPSQLAPLRAFTFLRLSSEMMSPQYQLAWGRFVRAMQKNAARFKTSRSWRQSLGLQRDDPWLPPV
ncbi:hypothetical protein N2152v2_006894 [Parachlorella kessleri]